MPEGNRLTPSVVAFTDKGDVLVGEPARRQAVTNPTKTVYSIKRFMGRRHSEVASEEKIVPYQVVGGAEDYVKVKVGDKEYTPPEISAMILRKLKEAAEAYLGPQGQQGRHHRAGLLQRRPAPGDQRRRPNRRPRSRPHHQRADRRGARPTVWTRKSAKKDRACSTSAAARSTSRCSKWPTACSASSAPTAIRTWAATTSIRC